MKEGGFNPELAIELTKMQPEHLRRDAMEAFHAERISQKEGIALIGGEVLDTIFAQPGIKLSELETMIREQGQDAGLSSKQVDVGRALIKEYGKRRDRLDGLKKQDLAPNDLFKQLVHLKSPLKSHERVSLDWRTFVVNFRVPDSVYTSLRGINKGDRSAGFFDRKRPHITFQRQSTYSKTVATHEEQHSMYHLVREVLSKRLSKTIFERPRPKVKDFVDRFRNEGPYRPAEEYIQQEIRSNTDRIKDEIFAFTREDARSPKEIATVLLKSETDGGLYDYFEDERRSLENMLKSAGKDTETIKDVVKLFFDEHQEVVKDAVAAIRKLKEEEGYTFHQAFLFLMDVPVELWTKEVDRLGK